MALSSDQLTTLQSLHDEDWLKRATNPGSKAAPSALTINETKLEAAVDATLAWFRRRGYRLSETDIEVLSWVHLFLVRSTLKTKEGRGEWQTLMAMYPVVAPSLTPSSTGKAEGEDGDRRNLSADQQEKLWAVHKNRRIPGREPGGRM